MALLAHSMLAPAAKPMSLPEMQSAWEMARAGRDLFTFEDDDKADAFGEVEDTLEDMMTAAPITTASDCLVKLWLAREAFDAGWSRKSMGALIDQIEGFVRSGTVGSLRAA